MGVLDPFAALLPTNWPLLALVTARVGGLVIAAPALALVLASASVRAAVVVLLAIVLVPLIPTSPFPVEDVAQLHVFVATEFLLGVGMGLLVEFFVAGVALAGDVVGMQMGLSAAALLDPASNAQLPVVAQFLRFLAMAVFFGMGGHLLVFVALRDSLVFLPPGGIGPLSNSLESLVFLGRTMFVTAVQVAAPTILSLLLVNIALAVLSRAAPQINVFTVSFPLTISIGLLAIALTLPLIGSLIADWANDLLEQLSHWLVMLLPNGT